MYRGLVRSTLLLAMVFWLGLSGCANQKKQQAVEQLGRFNSAAELARQGEAAYQSRDWELAKQYFTESLSHFDEQPQVYYRLGNIAFRQKQLAEAERHFEKVIALQPEYTKAYYNLAVVHLVSSERNFRQFSTMSDSALEKQGIARLLRAIADFSNPSNHLVKRSAVIPTIDLDNLPALDETP